MFYLCIMTLKSLDNKLLVLAGTHQREIGFSHPTADLVIRKLGGSLSKPDEEVYGIDGARKGELWNLTDKLSVGKIIKIGEPSKKYFETLSYERIKFLAKYKALTFGNGAEIAETFEHERQWTSVTSPLIDISSPSILFDLHSYHKMTRGINGTGAYINPHQNSLANYLIASALENAQNHEPKIYGDTKDKPFPSDNKYEKRKEIEEMIINSFSREEHLALLNDVELTKRLRKRLRQAYTKADEATYKNWGNNWYMLGDKESSAKDMDLSEYCFEAVAWGKEQQRATADFIVKYLVPLL